MRDARRLFLFCVASPVNRLDPAVEGGGNGIPELEEGIFLEPDVHEHRLDPGLDVADFALVNAADDVAVGFALDRVFLELVVLEERDALFEAFAADDELDSCGFLTDS